MENLIQSPQKQLQVKIREAQSSYNTVEKLQSGASKELLEINQKWLATRKDQRRAKVLSSIIMELDLVKERLNTYRETLIELKDKLPE